MNLTRRNILKALGITAIASILPIGLNAGPKTQELKVGDSGTLRAGDNIEIRLPVKFKANEPPSIQMVPQRKMYLVHEIKDRETLIVSEVI